MTPSEPTTEELIKWLDSFSFYTDGTWTVVNPMPMKNLVHAIRNRLVSLTPESTKDIEIIRHRICNPDFDHAEMNDAVAALDRFASPSAKASEDAIRAQAKGHTWPIAIIEDRYAGTYSDGKWIAFIEAYKNWETICEGPHNDDVTARVFDYSQNWLAVGNTPHEALCKLRDKK